MLSDARTGGINTASGVKYAGIETIEIPYSEIRKNGGGIHCSTLPLLRDEH
jgi:N-dimethylarginine dimethylaminohydrolase